ncbi:hypothetical protein [Nocardia miyunensis]|uniref:hypothetical protein n=1 Tax=Nocardia miyunensis TaxID=282684 RepID=UPI000833FCC0|nr:hypothetical protein [Nocardia miyunensis]
MRITSPLTPLFGALVVSAALAAGLLTPSPAHAGASGALAAVPVADASGACGHGSPTFDDVVTYLVNGLDAVRTRRLDHTMSVSRLTVNDVIEVFILTTRIVKIPAQVIAGLVPTAGFFLSFIVGGVFSGVKCPSTAPPSTATRRGCESSCATTGLTLAFAPVRYGAPILRGITQTMCPA